MEDTWQLGGAGVLMLMMMKVKDVLMMMLMMMTVKGQVTVKVLLEVKVVVKVFVVEEVLLFSLSSTPTTRTMPQTRPAARVWAWGAKGSGFPIVLHPGGNQGQILCQSPPDAISGRWHLSGSWLNKPPICPWAVSRAALPSGKAHRKWV